MEQIVKGFLSAFLILILVYLGMGLVLSSIDTKNADTFMENSVSKIEASNFAPEVLDGVKKDASELGYDLEFKSEMQNGDSQTAYTLATLKFDYRMPLIGLNKTQTINRDIR